MTEKNYVQCEIVRESVHEVCWLPIEFAREGMFLKIKKNGKWENGWSVALVYKKIVTDIATFAYNPRTAFPSLK